MWKRANHPNIVPFRGVTLKPLQLVSQWMPGGNLREHIGNNKNANLIDLVGPFLCAARQRFMCSLVTGHRQRPRLSPLVRSCTRGSQRSGFLVQSPLSYLFEENYYSRMSSSMRLDTRESPTLVWQASYGIPAQWKAILMLLVIRPGGLHPRFFTLVQSLARNLMCFHLQWLYLRYESDGCLRY